MREFGVRRYGDSLYHHCMADSAADAANWFAHFQSGVAGRDFQALVKDVAKPVSDESRHRRQPGGGHGAPRAAHRGWKGGNRSEPHQLPGLSAAVRRS